DPLDETGYELLIRCQLAAGREGSAMGTYARLERALAGAHGGQPGRVLRELRDEATRSPDGLAGGSAIPLMPLALVRDRRTPLVGRERELAALVAACAPEASRSLVLVEGESGMGKSRLLAELAAVVIGQGGLVLHGRSFLTDPLPFGAMQQALRGVPGGRLGDVARLRRMVSDAPGDATRSPIDPAARRFQAFNQISDALGAAARTTRGPCVLLLDDAQWLDPSSVELLGHVVRGGGAGRLRLVMAARPRPAGVDDPVGVIEAAVGGSVRITLEGDSPLLRRSGEELGATIVDESDLGAATAVVLGRADLAVRQLVHLIAIGGDELTLVELAAVIGCEPSEAAGLAALAVADGLLEEPGAPGRAGRIHDARRQAVIRSTAPGAIRSAHRSLAGALESLLDEAVERRSQVPPMSPGVAGRDDEVVRSWMAAYGARLAEHWRRAGGLVAHNRAALYGSQAAEIALEGLAFERAAELAEQARVDLLASMSSITASGTSELSLLLLQGQALNAAGRLSAAAPVWLRAIEVAEATGSPDDQARAVLGLAGPRLGGAVQVPGLREALEASLRRSPADPSLEARVRSRLAGELRAGPVDERRALAESAIELARATGDGAAVADALLWRHLVKICDAEVEGRAALVDEAEQLARGAGRLDLALHARMVRFSDLVEAGRIDDADDELQGWDAEATEAQLPYNRWAAAVCAPTIALARCDLPVAIEGIRRAERLAAPLGDDWMVRSAIGGQWLSVQIVQGDIDGLRAVLEPLVASAAETNWVWGIALALGELIAGNDDRALELIDGPLRAGVDTLVDALRLPSLSFLAIVATTAGAPAPALEDLRRAMEPHAAVWATQHYGGTTHGPLATRIALVDVALGDLDRARARLAPYAVDPAEAEAAQGDELVQLAILMVQARILAASGQLEESRALHRTLADASREGGAHGWAALFERNA
ncbi:MAG: AAA family ATPase, partial [Solirubrobacteraceae bacterium]|nr:AAA family ATPase [Solirubrobacteraceae bacterium]